MHTRRIAVAVASALAVAVASDVADAGRRAQRRRVQVGRVTNPLGMQGLAGAGPRMVIGFTLLDPPRQRVADIEAQFAVDWNADGELSEDEWRPCTEDRADLRGTRSPFAPFLFGSGSEYPVENGFVWDQLADLGSSVRAVSLEYALDVHGRLTPDPHNPGSWLFARLPSGGVPIFSGVRVRVRTLTPRRGRRHPLRGDWTVSDSFALDNNRAPSMTIDSVEAGSPVLVHWTAYDADSGRVGVAFDFHVLGDGEDVAAMDDYQLATLSWSACTRLAGSGDTDSLDARPGVPVPTTGDLAGVESAPLPYGRSWVFAWDMPHDVADAPLGVILRATPFDETRAIGKTVYSRTIVYESN